MPNIIELNLLENKSIVATMQGYPLGNENSYKIIAGEENATKFIIKSIPNQYANARLTVEMVNSQGLGIAERELSEIEIDLVSYKGFVLPKGMAVAGYGYILIRAYIEEEVAVFQPLKIKVWNTISQWQDYVDKTANVKVVDGYLILTENGNEYNLGYVRGEQGATGAKLISQELVGQDENGGNIYQQTFDDGTVAYFTAPKGELSVEEGEDLLTKTVADETYAKKTEYATNSTPGTVIVGGPFYGLYIGPNGILIVHGAFLTDIDAKTSDARPLTPKVLDHAVKVGLTTNTEALTDEEKEEAQTWLGVKKYYTHALIFHKSGSLSFTVDRITSEPTAYLNCTTPMADNLFCTNSKSIVLNGINDLSGVKSGVGTLMATMTPYADENGENSGVRLSGVWINYATGEVSQVSNFEVPFEQDVVTEL